MSWLNNSLITLLALSISTAFAAEEFDPKTEKTVLEMMQESPDAIPLEPRDESRDVRILRRTAEERQGNRKPGIIEIHQTYGGLAFQEHRIDPCGFKGGKGRRCYHGCFH